MSVGLRQASIFRTKRNEGRANSAPYGNRVPHRTGAEQGVAIRLVRLPGGSSIGQSHYLAILHTFQNPSADETPQQTTVIRHMAVSRPNVAR